MEIVLCKLTLETLDAGFEEYLKDNLSDAKVIVAKCIGCCGECTTQYIVLKNGKPISADTKERLLEYLLA